MARIFGDMDTWFVLYNIWCTVKLEFWYVRFLIMLFLGDDHFEIEFNLCLTALL